MKEEEIGNVDLDATLSLSLATQISFLNYQLSSSSPPQMFVRLSIWQHSSFLWLSDNSIRARGAINWNQLFICAIKFNQRCCDCVGECANEW